MKHETAYRLEALRHRRGGATVLEIPRLEIAAGRIHGVVGANGAGKSTLLSLLALLEEPTAGTITVVGQPAIAHGPRAVALRRQVTLIHQKPYLLSATVAANLAFGLKARRMARNEIAQRVENALAEVGLAGFEARPARKLSGGEAQRVVLARALILDTPILLLDEPTSFLDATVRPVLADLLSRRNKGFGTTVIFATHEAGFAHSLAHTILRMDRGRVTIEENGKRNRTVSAGHGIT